MVCELLLRCQMKLRVVMTSNFSFYVFKASNLLRHIACMTLTDKYAQYLLAMCCFKISMFIYRSICFHFEYVATTVCVLGTRNSHAEYTYGDYWDKLHGNGNGLLTKLHVAFSRDQSEKVYVTRYYFLFSNIILCLIHDD